MSNSFLTGQSMIDVSEKLKFLGPQLMIFVVTSILKDPDYARALKNFEAAGCQFGSHSVSHRKLTSLTYAQQVEELRRSKYELEVFLNRPVKAFRAPGFFYDSDTLRALDETNYEYHWSRVPGRIDKSLQNIRLINLKSPVSELKVDSYMGIPLGGGYLRYIKRYNPRVAQHLLRSYCCYCHPWEFIDLTKLQRAIKLPPKFFVETGPDLLSFYADTFDAQ